MANQNGVARMELDGGGALMNQGVHTVDLLLWLLGDVTRVQARTATALHKIESEDTAIAILEFASGALGTLQATTAAYPGYPRRVEITGSEGTVILEHDRIIAADLRNPPRGFGLRCAGGHQSERILRRGHRCSRPPGDPRRFPPRHRTDGQATLRRGGRTQKRRADRSHLPRRPQRHTGAHA